MSNNIFTKGLPPQQQAAYERASAYDSKIEQDAYLDGSQDMYEELSRGELNNLRAELTKAKSGLSKMSNENRILREGLEFYANGREVGKISGVEYCAATDGDVYIGNTASLALAEADRTKGGEG